MKVVRRFAVVAVPLALMAGACGEDEQNAAPGALDAATEADAATDAASDAPAETAPKDGASDGAPDGGGAASDAGPDGDAGDASASACPTMLVVGSSDYISTNVSTLWTAGTVRTESLFSSATDAGVTTSLSGDAVLPSQQPAAGQVVVIDRKSSMLSWVSSETGTVVYQLPVGTGYAANPHDYVDVSSSKAYVSRYDSNPAPGDGDFSAGGDLLVLDTAAHAIVGRIDLARPGDGAFQPRPDRMLRVGEDVWVALQRFTSDFLSAGDGRIVGVSTSDDTVAWVLDLPNLANCSSPVLAPSRTVAALVCADVYGSTAGHSGVVLLDASARPPTVLRTIDAATQLGSTLAPSLSFASEHLLVGAAVGTLGGDPDYGDRVFSIDVSATTPVAQPILDAVQDYVLGDVRCVPGCGDLCFVADSAQKVLRVWQVNGTALTSAASRTVDPVVGLAPRSIGVL